MFLDLYSSIVSTFEPLYFGTAGFRVGLAALLLLFYVKKLLELTFVRFLGCYFSFYLVTGRTEADFLWLLSIRASLRFELLF